MYQLIEMQTGDLVGSEPFVFLHAYLSSSCDEDAF